MFYNLQKKQWTTRFFEHVPEIPDPAFRYFWSSSAFDVLENGKLKMVEKNKTVKHIKVFVVHGRRKDIFHGRAIMDNSRRLP